MSDKTSGVIFEAGNSDAVDFFCDLQAGTFLRLTRVDERGLWGIYAEGWPGDAEVLDEVARTASVRFGKGLRYLYDGCVGFLCDLYEHGERTQSEDPDAEADNPFSANVFAVFGRDRSLHNKIEDAFCWRNADWELEATPRDGVAKK